ncbi:crld-1, partial [Pristionchus pacificus]
FQVVLLGDALISALNMPHSPSNLFLRLLLVVAVVNCKLTPIKNEKCKSCSFLVDTFNVGLEKTANKHFAGGDTAWEEKNLGKYKTSETRLVEVMEGVCKKRTMENTDKYSGVKELEFKCSALFEDNEEPVEEWYKSQQDLDLFSHLCVDNLKICCPDGRFGKECAACPGVEKGAQVCFGHGDCHGDGSREGTGKCKCSDGYTGHACQHCDANYFSTKKTETEIECSKCHDSCAGGCTGSSAKECVKCATGWIREDEECIDVDECKADGDNERCTGAYEVCVNTVGSYRCDCDTGYIRNKDGICEVDVVAPSHLPLLPPHRLLRLVAYSGLIAVITLIYSFHRSTLCVIFTIFSVVASILIEVYVNPDTIPDGAKSFLSGL